MQKQKKMSNNANFEKNGYIYLPKMIENPQSLVCEVPKERGQFKYHKNDICERLPEEQVDGSFSRYNFPCSAYKELYFLVRKELETILGMDLFPTYYFDRFYFVGQELKRHIDRPSCEVSVTIQIGSNRQEPWPIWFKKPNGEETFINMNNGDAVIYKGCEIEHWREPLRSKYNKFEQQIIKMVNKEDNTYHHQIFLHYVNANGPYVQHAYDQGR